MRRTVVISLLGPTLDSGAGPSRWDRWRPTVSLGQHEDLAVDRLELLSQAKYDDLADTVAGDFRQVSPETEIRRHRIEYADPWDFEEVYTTLLDFARGYPFDPENEDYLVHITTGTHVMQICLFLLVESRIIPGKLIQTGTKARSDTIGSFTVIDLDLSKYDRIAERFQVRQKEGLSFLKSGIRTLDPGFNRLIARIEKVAAASDAPILITGASGTGKTRLARLIYDWKRQNHRVNGEFVEVNCATLKGDAAMSALFGHRKGAYTGADEAREGLMAKADGGLLFLDEIEALGIDEQAVLLRAIEEKRFYPLGSDREIKSDFGLICGTNRDLVEMAAEGKFRSDLLARIELWTFELPDLRSRSADIEPNLDYELERISADTGRAVRINREARARFLKLAAAPDALWTGNFRDLAGAVARMSTLSESGRITETLVNEEFERLRAKWRRLAGTDASSASSPSVDEARARELLAKVIAPEALEALDPFDIVELSYVVRTALQCRTLSEAGRRLFVKSLGKRTSSNDSDRLRKYLARFSLSWAALEALKTKSSSEGSA